MTASPQPTANPLAPEWLSVPADVNELNPDIWPSNLQRSASGEAVFAGIPVTELAARYGTPLYLIDRAQLRERATQIREAFEGALGTIGAQVTVYYAGKAFLSADVVRWMLDAGLSIDTSTGGELALALAAGAPGKKIGLHGNNKSQAELELAVSAGIKAVVLDHPEEIEQLAEIARRHSRVQGVRLRVRSGVHAHTHEFLATSHDDQKFGVGLAEVPELVAKIRQHPELEFLGLHAHIGSQIFGSEGFAASAAVLAELHAQLLEGGPVPELNIGGGFGIAYTEADQPAQIGALAASIAESLEKSFTRHGLSGAALPRIAIEPGRWIIGPTGITLYTLGARKDVAVPADDGSVSTRRYLSVDGGMSDNARPALYGADYTARLVSRSSSAAPVLVRIAGKHCESGDIVVQDDYFPEDAHGGDLAAVAATGAYCWSLSSNYNFVNRPAVVAVEDGAVQVLVRAETLDDLLRRDAGLTQQSSAASTTETGSQEQDG